MYNTYMIGSGIQGRSSRAVVPPARMMWLGLAYTAVGLGAVGAVLPVMPTTPFLLVALWAGARSSPRLRYRLYRHPRYGATLRAWHRHGVVPASAKWAACSLMALSALMLWLGDAPAFVLTAVGGLFALVTAFILTRPSTPPGPECTRP